MTPPANGDQLPQSPIFPFVNTNHRRSYPAINPSLASLSSAGKTVLIAGGASGIGFETARAFATAGAARVILVARSVNTLATAKQELSTTFPKTTVITYPLDICKNGDVETTFADIRTSGEVDLVILSAAVIVPHAPALHMTAEVLDKVMDVNLNGNLNMIQAYLSTGVKGKSIINLSTGGVHMFVPGSSAYGVSKAAFTQVLNAVYLENKDEGLHVVQIHPGIHSTPLARNAGMPHHIFDWDDIKLPAHFCVWLASPEAAFLSGKFVWAAWDVDELKAKKEEFNTNPSLLTIGLHTK